MRVLQVSEDIPYPSLGGLAKHVMTLVRALIRDGHQVDVLGGIQHPLEVAGADGEFDGQFFGELRWHLTGWKENRLGVFMPPRRPWIARNMARCIVEHADSYDVVHYHGHFPTIGKYIPERIPFLQTRHDQGSDCLRNTRFRDGGICNRLDAADCASCITSKPNALQRVISAISVKNHRKDVVEAYRRHKTIFVSDMLRRNFVRVAGPGEWGKVLHNFVDIVDASPTADDVELSYGGGGFPLRICSRDAISPKRHWSACRRFYKNSATRN